MGANVIHARLMPGRGVREFISSLSVTSRRDSVCDSPVYKQQSPRQMRTIIQVTFVTPDRLSSESASLGRGSESDVEISALSCP